MHIRYLAVFMFGLFALTACGTKGEMVLNPVSTAEAAETETYMLGDTPVKIEVSRVGNGYGTFVALHESESISVAAAKEVLSRHGGKLVQLIHGGGRNVKFTHQGRSYEFDPNRIFTRNGRKQTIKGGYNQETERLVAGLAEALLKHLKSPVVIALHNNTNGAYSILQYKTGGVLARDAHRVKINSDQDPDDFYLVVGQQLYDILSRTEYNVVLQSRSPTDDGSLSVYMGKTRTFYVNVEAEQVGKEGHLAIQTRMIEILVAD